MLHYGIDGKADCGGDGVIAGMALVGAAVFTAQQIGVDRDRSVAQPQVKHFIRHSEEFAALYIGQDRDEVDSEQFMIDKSECALLIPPV